MHELSVAVQIRTVLDGELDSDDGPLFAECVHVRVGALANIVPEALQFAWPHAVDGSPALDGSSIEIEWVDAALRCRDCDATHTTPTLVSLRCPACHSGRVEVVGGDELEITGVDLRHAVTAPP